MAICNVSNASQLRSSFLRLDAEYFKPEYVQAFERISSVPDLSPLGEISERVTQGSNPVFSVEGLPCVNGKNVYFGTMTEGEPNFVSPIEFNRLENFTLRSGDLVITLKHATKVGRIWIVEDDEPRIFSRNIGLIRLQPTAPILGSVLLLYLWSDIGQLLIDRCATGGTTGQITLPMSELKRIPIPLFRDSDQRKLDALFWQSRDAAREAAGSYLLAQQLLDAELGIDRLGFGKPVGYTVRLSDLELSRRADPDFFNPELRYYQQEIAKAYPLKPITDSVTILKFANPPYGKEGTPIITQKHLGKISPDNYGSDLVAQPTWVSANPLALLRRHDLLYYSVGAYLGKTNIWLSTNTAVHASFITMLRCREEEDAGFLQVLLNSNYGILQSKCFQSGTSQPYIYPKDIRHFLIPDTSVALRRKIHQLVIESQEKAEKSKQLLQQAKSRVEQLIEEAVQP